jgi:hypothetical protein
LEWWKLVPRFDDEAWSSSADPSRSLISSDGEGTHVIFFFGNGASTGTLNRMADHFTYLAQWFNPRDGQYEHIGTFTVRGGHWVIPDRPGAGDWVLLVRRTSSSHTKMPGERLH